MRVEVLADKKPYSIVFNTSLVSDDILTFTFLIVELLLRGSVVPGFRI